MSHLAHMRAPLPRTSQSWRAVGFLPAPTTPALELCSSPSTSSPKDRSFAWHGAEDDAGHQRAWFTHSLLLQPGQWQPKGCGPTAVPLHRHPECQAVLHASVSVQRHPSSYFPCSPSVTRFGAYPAPCGTARLCFGLSAALRVSAFRKSFCDERRKEKIFRTFRKSAVWPWERGTFTTPARTNRVLGDPGTRVASRKSVPRAIRANTNKEKRKWHSTETKSS